MFVGLSTTLQRHSSTSECPHILPVSLLNRDRALELEEEGWSLPDLLFQQIDPLEQKRTESNRDYYRRILPYMLKVQLRKKSLSVYISDNADETADDRGVRCLRLKVYMGSMGGDRIQVAYMHCQLAEQVEAARARLQHQGARRRRSRANRACVYTSLQGRDTRDLSPDYTMVRR